MNNSLKRLYSILFSILLLGSVAGREQPVARFSFNKGRNDDEISGRKAGLVGVNFTADRFGNSNSAIYFFGNEHSYLNLGTGAHLKPRAGTISLWAKIELEVFSGTGTRTNPILITKNSIRDDFYEAYAIYYFPETKRIEACMQIDSIIPPCTIYSTEGFSRLQWHHLAITYDDRIFEFFIDGKSQGKVPKSFVSLFNDKDSVILGVSANVKNNRFTNGAVDDIHFFDKVLSEREIYDLYKAPNPNRWQVLLNCIILGLAIIALIYIIVVVARYRLKRALGKERQELELRNTALETELRVNRALMDPHFVFNSMNTLQRFILQSDKVAANNYLVKFSKLLRRILESNMSNVISLEVEIELLTRYLELEDLRFEENIKHTFIIDPAINPSRIKIPVMMLQPFVENSIWHGLLTKEGEKMITISFSLLEEKYLRCIIEDNGSGRKPEIEMPGERKSLATKFIKQRLELLNRLHNLQCTLEITDKPRQSGTIVEILLPILGQSTLEE